MTSSSCRLQFLKLCTNCHEFYDDHESNLGLKKETCLKCNINKLKNTDCHRLYRCQSSRCKPCFEWSFASHEKAIYWHPTMNGNIKPRSLSKHDKRKYWLTCQKCGHNIHVPLCWVCTGGWCGYCNSKKRCSNPDCKFCFEKSFASHDKAKYWHPTLNGNIRPRDVARYDDRKYWFNCDVCFHNIDITLSNVQAGNWCGYCRNQKRCNEPSCQMCFNNSLASHEHAKHWHQTKNGNIVPRDVAKYDDRKYWFTCDICNKDIHMSATNIRAGKWCTCRKNKTEAKFLDFLLSTFDNVKKQFKLESCKNSETGRSFPFDFCLPSIKIIIEIDGR